MVSIPEHTVDCWVSIYLAEALPNIELWAPTPMGPDNWDIAGSLGPGQLFLLESKSAKPVQNWMPIRNTPRIEINRHQLAPYLGFPPKLVYCLLPDPPWKGVPPPPPNIPAPPFGLE